MMAFLELAAAVRPATGFVNAGPEFANPLVGNIGIGQQIALESREERFRANAAAIRGVEEAVVRMMDITSPS